LLAACLGPGGELVVYGASSRLPIQLSQEHLTTRGVRVRGFSLSRWSADVGSERVAAELEALAKLELREHVVGRFTLEQWPDALEQAERVGARGRVVFTPGAAVIDPRNGFRT
jgi:trans-2-enoyl-CoA reductase